MWFSAVKPSTSKPPEVDPRQAKREKLQAERLERSKQREARQKQLQSAIQAQREADQALQELLDIDPEILTGDNVTISDNEIEQLLADETLDQQPTSEAGTMADDFEKENGTDGRKEGRRQGRTKTDGRKEGRNPGRTEGKKEVRTHLHQWPL